LASGNQLLEATCSALCEVIERDGLACWQYRGPKSRAARRMLLDSISDENCNGLLERLTACDMDVAIWDLTTDIGVPVFLCRLGEASCNGRSQHGEFWGCGCHSTTGIALIRAMTEAVQTRLTYIAGSRDDLRRRHYSTQPRSAFASSLELWERTRSGTLFDTVPSEHNANFEENLASLLGHLRAAGLSHVLRVDLTNERFGIPVVRIVVPGLETWTGEGREAIGARAKAVQRTAH
jgi:ribosomal protein S12 methylthiotransferase accessory factor